MSVQSVRARPSWRRRSQQHRFDTQVVLHVDVHLQALLEDGLKLLDCLEYQAGGEQASTAFELIAQVDLEVGAALCMYEYHGDDLGQAIVDIRLKYNGVAVVQLNLRRPRPNLRNRSGCSRASTPDSTLD